MKNAAVKYFNRDNVETDERSATRNGVLRDGCRMVVPTMFRDSAARANKITDGTDNALGLQKPGWRIPVVSDRRAVRDAYEQYEADLISAYRDSKKSENEDDDDDDEDENKGKGGKKNFGSNNSPSDSRSAEYAAYDNQIRDAWRG